MALELANMNYFSAAVVILFGILVALVARSVVRWLESKAGETETKWDDIIIAAIGTPVQVAIVVISVYIACKYFGILPANLQWILDPQHVMAFYIFFGAWILSTLLHDIISIYGHELAEKTEGDTDDRLIELLELVIRYVIWFLAFVLILSVYEVNITPFLAGAGIAGLAVALAAQDLISNFFGGALITVDKPFKVGDRIKVDDYYGDVLSVGPRSTRLKTLDYQIVTIPNNKITTNIIINYNEPDPRLRMTIPISVAYGTNPLRVKEILLEIAQDAIKNTDYFVEDPAPTAFFIEFAESSLNFILRIWTQKNLPENVKDVINCRIAERFAKEGIEVPFPQMEIRMKK
jgi:small-conductance mechanosensitive channel